MTKAVKCLACGLYYNGQVYNECPHCKAKQEPDKETEKALNQRGNTAKIDTPDINEEQNPKVNKDDPPQKQKRYTVPYNRIPTGTEHEANDILPEKQEEEQCAEAEKIEQRADEIEGEDKKEIGQKADIISQNEFADDLIKQLKKSGRTVGKFTSADGRRVDPVVGWIVCVKGPYYGQSFALHSGRNKMGRSQDFDVRLLNDESVSRSCVAVIMFDAKASTFSIISGDSDSLCYVNGEALYERKVLVGYEQIELGDSERNMFVFVPLCGEQFSWISYQATK